MQSFKFACGQIDTFTKKSKQHRQQDIRQIKKLYKQLQEKQEKPFENTLQRITKNISFYRQKNFKQCYQNIDTKDIVDKYMSKLQEYDDEIIRMSSILEKGCGKVVVKNDPEEKREKQKQAREETNHENEDEKLQKTEEDKIENALYGDN